MINNQQVSKRQASWPDTMPDQDGNDVSLCKRPRLMATDFQTMLIEGLANNIVNLFQENLKQQLMQKLKPQLEDICSDALLTSLSTKSDQSARNKQPSLSTMVDSNESSSILPNDEDTIQPVHTSEKNSQILNITGVITGMRRIVKKTKQFTANSIRNNVFIYYEFNEKVPSRSNTMEQDVYEQVKINQCKSIVIVAQDKFQHGVASHLFHSHLQLPIKVYRKHLELALERNKFKDQKIPKVTFVGYNTSFVSNFIRIENSSHDKFNLPWHEVTERMLSMSKANTSTKTTSTKTTQKRQDERSFKDLGYCSDVNVGYGREKEFNLSSPRLLHGTDTALGREIFNHMNDFLKPSQEWGMELYNNKERNSQYAHQLSSSGMNRIECTRAVQQKASNLCMDHCDRMNSREYPQVVWNSRLVHGKESSPDGEVRQCQILFGRKSIDNALKRHSNASHFLTPFKKYYKSLPVGRQILSVESLKQATPYCPVPGIKLLKSNCNMQVEGHYQVFVSIVYQMAQAFELDTYGIISVYCAVCSRVASAIYAYGAFTFLMAHKDVLSPNHDIGFLLLRFMKLIDVAKVFQKVPCRYQNSTNCSMMDVEDWRKLVNKVHSAFVNAKDDKGGKNYNSVVKVLNGLPGSGNLGITHCIGIASILGFVPYFNILPAEKISKNYQKLKVYFEDKVKFPEQRQFRSMLARAMEGFERQRVGDPSLHIGYLRLGENLECKFHRNMRSSSGDSRWYDLLDGSFPLVRFQNKDFYYTTSDKNKFVPMNGGTFAWTEVVEDNQISYSVLSPNPQFSYTRNDRNDKVMDWMKHFENELQSSLKFTRSN